MPNDELIIQGARQNNLKNISLRIPHDKVIAVTGVSGSGKSSLAFETIFAEGQWRFIESLSTYARLFLEKMDRPDVDGIYNIRPAIALEQRNPVRGSRTTVGTLTEIYDFLRLLYSKSARPYCTGCGAEIRSWDPSAIKAELLGSHEGAKAILSFKTDLGLGELIEGGYRRVIIGGEVLDLTGLDAATAVPPFEVVLDRLVIKDEPRLSDSLEMAIEKGGGSLRLSIIDGPSLSFGAGNVCDACGLELAEPSPILFSFNHPVGACPECKGFGNVLCYDENLVVPLRKLSLSEGAIEPWEKPAAKWWKRKMLQWADRRGVDIKTPYEKLPKKHRDMLFKGDEGFYGVNDFFEELESMRYKLHVRVFLSRYRKGVNCPSCGGKRLGPEALAYKLGGMDIASISEHPIKLLKGIMEDLDLSPFERDVVKEPLRQINLKLDFLMRVGLGYLTLDREGKTLSGGEYQRINLSNQMASRLTGTLYVLDEPTVGLHRRDTDRVAAIMADLSAEGNTVVVVEHDRGIIESADWVVELGPGGGSQGGQVVFDGSLKDFLKADTLTSRYITGKDSIRLPQSRRKPKGRLNISGATGNNLKDVELKLPLKALTAVTGVSGSGKSTLVVGTLYSALKKKLRRKADEPLPYRALKGHAALGDVKLIDQSPIGRSPRSNPVTYLKIFDPIRKLFAAQPLARSNGHGPGFFSFNVPGGRCETCKGEGYQRLEMYFFEDLYIKCEDCSGRRYGHDALRVRYMDKSIDEVLGMTVKEAMAFFSGMPKVISKLSLMDEIGLGYLRLGQAATTLSGGEAQRLKICSELGARTAGETLYILDEPTVGLHFRDVAALMKVLNKLVDAGNTVLVIEHNLDVIASADWVVDLGPEGGDEGGRVLYSGPPEGLRKIRKSYTGKYLKEVL